MRFHPLLWILFSNVSPSLSSNLSIHSLIDLSIHICLFSFIIHSNSSPASGLHAITIFANTIHSLFISIHPPPQDSHFLRHPHAITIFADTMYWTDRTGKTLLSCNKYACDNKTIHATSFKEPLGLTALHKLRHPCEGDCR